MTENTTTTTTLPATVAADVVAIVRDAAERIVNTAEDGATMLASFESSAGECFRAVRAGAKPAHIAAETATVAVERGIAERGEDGKIRIVRPGVSSNLYTTPTAIGWHWRTGAFLALPGDLYLKPEGAKREVIADATTTQAVLRQISQPLVAKILTQAHAEGLDRAAAWKMIKEAVEAAEIAAAAAVVDGEDDDDTTTPTTREAVTIAKRCAAITGNLGKINASAQAGDAWSEEDRNAWDAIVSQVLATEALRAAQAAGDAATAAARDALAEDEDENVPAVA